MDHISSLITPCVVIEKAKFKRNCERMADVATRQNLTLRPHVKTLKSLEAAQYYAPANMPITVSTLAEANYFADGGYSDILYAVGLTPNKFTYIAALQEKAGLFTITLDSLEAAKSLCTFASELATPLQVVLEIDTDDHRAGLLPESLELMDCARLLKQTSNLHLRGLMTHAGASYDCFSDGERQDMAKQECERIALAARRLEQQGITCELISAGSTPTALSGITHKGINELRAGVYATFDCVMAGLGVCAFDDIAMSVLTSVIGHQQDKNWVLVDAGWMALSRDQGTSSHKLDCAYGLVCDINGKLLDGWYVTSTNQEHGILRHRDGKAPKGEHLAYGKLLRILPIHACATAAQHSHYHLIGENQCVEARWNSIQGW